MDLKSERDLGGIDFLGADNASLGVGERRRQAMQLSKGHSRQLIYCKTPVTLTIS